MNVFLLNDVEKLGMTGEIVKVSDGYAQNFLLPRKLAVQVTPNNARFFKAREKVVEKRQEVIENKGSMLSEKIKGLQLKLKRKVHDGGKLYGSINPVEVVDLLATKGIKISKSQVEIDKSIKNTGTFDVTIKLSTKLRPTCKLSVVGA